MKTYKCINCNINFEARIRKNRIKRYCSVICFNNSKIKLRIKLICITCNKEFSPKFPSQNNRKFCSHKCIRYSGSNEKLGLYKGFWKTLSEEEKLIKLKESFEKLVIKNIEGCWDWKKVVNNTGYGSICIGKGKSISAHRASWIIYNGKISDGLFVLHKCDNKKCTKPEHLFLGTHIDNMRDMVKKDRQFKKRI